MPNRAILSLFVAAGLICSLCAGPVSAQPFVDISATITPVHHGSLAWGDYDNDGDFDLVLMGWASKLPHEPTYSFLYRNDGGTFVDAAAGLPGLQCSAVAWGDYDRDGDLDLAVCGQTKTFNFERRTNIYRNDGGTFTNSAAGIPNVNNGSLAWGDYDNDGDLDLAVAGWTGSQRFTRIYRQTSGSFTDAGAGLVGISSGQLAWADFDNDGDLDLAVAGWTGGTTLVTKLYRNQGGVFTDIDAGLPGVSFCALAWGDYDNNGYLDLLLSGGTGRSSSSVHGVLSKIYANSDGTFFDAAVGLEGDDGRGSVMFCANGWGDYDNDGLSDVVLTGWTVTPTMSTRVGRILRNNADAGPFTKDEIGAGIGAMEYSCVGWGDFDSDGDLDIAYSGQKGDSSAENGGINRNDSPVFNSGPSAPGDLSATVSGSDITFTWTAATDDHTPAGGLTYNLRVGTSAGSDNKFGAMANLTSGYRRLPALGNAQKRLSWTLHGLTARPLYWSVQAIDGAFIGGTWAAEAQVP
jgi:hypothetical protein